MSAATAEPEVKRPAVRAPEKVAVFESKRHELMLVKKKDPFVMDANGDKVYGVGERVQFRDGHLRVPFSGKTRGTRGETIDCKELLAWLEGDENNLPHPMFDNREEGFWRLHEPAPEPSEGELEAVVALAEAQDLEGLLEFVEAEKAGWGRAKLLKAAEGAAERVRARQADSKAAADTAKNEKPAPAVQAK